MCPRCPLHSHLTIYGNLKLSHWAKLTPVPDLFLAAVNPSFIERTFQKLCGLDEVTNLHNYLTTFSPDCIAILPIVSFYETDGNDKLGKVTISDTKVRTS